MLSYLVGSGVLSYEEDGTIGLKGGDRQRDFALLVGTEVEETGGGGLEEVLERLDFVGVLVVEVI